MQVGSDGPLLECGYSDWELSERGPVLPSYIAHQAELGCDLVEHTRHHLLRHFHGNIDLGSTDSLAKTGKNRTEVREMRPKAELVIDWRLIGESNTKFGDRPQQNADVAAESDIPRLEPQAAVRNTRTNVVDLRLEEETSA